MAAATMTAEREWTYDDYVRLDDEKRYEIIKGFQMEVAEIMPSAPGE